MILVLFYFQDQFKVLEFNGRHHCEPWDFNLGRQMVKTEFIYIGF